MHLHAQFLLFHCGANQQKNNIFPVLFFFFIKIQSQQYNGRDHSVVQLPFLIRHNLELKNVEEKKYIISDTLSNK